jgi:hypothetical protein
VPWVDIIGARHVVDTFRNAAQAKGSLSHLPSERCIRLSGKPSTLQSPPVSARCITETSCFGLYDGSVISTGEVRFTPAPFLNQRQRCHHRIYVPVSTPKTTLDNAFPFNGLFANSLSLSCLTVAGMSRSSIPSYLDHNRNAIRPHRD